MFNHATLGVVLILVTSLAGWGLDIDPPEVPNPYGTSEGRAIRDALVEMFKIKASETASIESLRSLYRKTWNDDQENRYLDGRQVDPRYASAKKDEENRHERDSLRADLVKIGGTAPANSTTEELKAAIAARKDAIHKEKQEQEIADRKRAAEEASRLIEAEQAATKQPSATSSERGAPTVFGRRIDPKNVLLFIPPVTAKDGMSDDQIIARMKLIKDQPTMSAVEHAEVITRAKDIIAERNRWIQEAHAKRILVSDDGVEIWECQYPALNDPEKMIYMLKFINMTTRAVDIVQYSVDFGGTTRNKNLSVNSLTAFAFPGTTRNFVIETLYNDATQTIAVSVRGAYEE